ncbi:MAG TPA: hypothetical protein HPP77_04730 [Candidatus Hydrogenedentes bacterium]|nr:hypothetical protein [Candidatus Hydrogenedentota bacterium]
MNRMQTRTRRCTHSVLKILPALVATALVFGCGAPTAEDPYAHERDMLQEIGIAFRLYANEHKEYYPPRSAEPGVFQPDMTEFAEYFSDTSEGRKLVDYITGQRGVDLCYLGHLVMDEEAGLTLLDHYAEEGAEAVRDRQTIPFDEEMPGRMRPRPIKGIVRMKEDLGRFFRREIGNPGAPGGGNIIPLLWEMPDSPNQNGGLVLYLDGHAQWRRYPGEFPMTQRFITRVRQMTAPGDAGVRRESQDTDTSTGAGIETQAGDAVAPTEEIAKAALIYVYPPRPWDIAESGPWDIRQCDRVPTVEVEGHNGYRILLRCTDIKYSEDVPSLRGLAQDKLAASGKYKWPVVEESHKEILLFPAKIENPLELKDRIPWADVQMQEDAEPFYLGCGRGYHWFGRMTVWTQAYLRRSFQLTDGQDLLELALRELGRAKDERARSSAFRLLAEAGERAIPILEEEIRRDVYGGAPKAVAALGRIPGDESSRVLMTLYSSDEARISEAAGAALVGEEVNRYIDGAWRLVGPDLRPAAKPAYIDLLEKGKDVRRISQAVIAFDWRDTKDTYLTFLQDRVSLRPSCDVAVHFGWEEALPLLEAICGNPSHFWECKTAFEAKRTLEGKPLTDEVKEAEQLIWTQTSCYPENQPAPSAVEEAIRTIGEYADEEVAALIALKCAIFEGGMTCGVREINKAGREILERIPADVTVPLIERLVGKLEDERTKGKLVALLEDMTAVEQAGTHPARPQPEGI